MESQPQYSEFRYKKTFITYSFDFSCRNQIVLKFVLGDQKGQN